MPVVKVVNQTGKKVSEIDLADQMFNVAVKPAVLHEVVTMQLASKRSGTACVKHRSDVKGSTRKLFRQKGTGRARRGNIRSPLLRGGGVAFGPIPKSHGYRVPKRVRKLALKMALSSKLQENNLVVVDDMTLKEIKTKEFVKVMDNFDFDNCLVVTGGDNNTASANRATVSGGTGRSATGIYDWVAGGLFQDQ